jgi:hypothetical protein
LNPTLTLGHPDEAPPSRDLAVLADLFFAATGIHPKDAVLIREELPSQHGRRRARFYFDAKPHLNQETTPHVPHSPQ